MPTRIEIDGFKTFENFSLDLEPFTAIVGPNASGKSNLFDALRFLSLLAKDDIRRATQQVRGEPEELFGRTSMGLSSCMSFAVEVLLSRSGVEAFGTKYETPVQRLRYELKLAMVFSAETAPKGIFVRDERCVAIAQRDERAAFLRNVSPKISYSSRLAPFIKPNAAGDAVEARQDGRQKRGRPITIPLKEASRTALSTITTAEFPHL